MAIAAFLICTTFVTNVPDGSIVTRQCQAETPRIEIAEQSSFAKLRLRTMNDVTTKPQEQAAAGMDANPPPVASRSASRAPWPHHAKRFIHFPRRRHRSSCCTIEVLPAAYVAHQDTRPSFWDQLKMAHQRHLGLASDR